MKPALIDTKDIRALAVSAVAGSIVSSAATLSYLAAIAAPLGFNNDDPVAVLVISVAVVMVCIFLTTVTSAAAFSLGLGWRALSNRKGWVSWWRDALVGVVVGGATGAGAGVAAGKLTDSVQPYLDLWVEPTAAVSIGAITGLVMATTAWLIRRPDRKSPSPPSDPAWERLTRP